MLMAKSPILKISCGLGFTLRYEFYGTLKFLRARYHLRFVMKVWHVKIVETFLYYNASYSSDLPKSLIKIEHISRKEIIF